VTKFWLLGEKILFELECQRGYLLKVVILPLLTRLA